MDTLYIYQIGKIKPMLQAHKNQLENELYHNQDKDIEKIITLEIEYINSILRAMNKTSKRMREMKK
jgi:hypothetical protein